MARILVAALVTILLGAPFADARAQTSGGLKMELNRLEDIDGACRAWFVLENNSDTTFAAYTADFVFFNRQDEIQRRSLVIFSPILPRKTHAKVYDIKDTTCSAVGKILLNDVHECKSSTVVLDNCVMATEVSSRAGIALFK